MKTHYHWLHYLRGIAALMIVFFHLQTKHEESTTYHISQHLWVFVDLFFVLSGFVNASSIQGASDNRFLIKRAIRIFPLLAFVNAAQLLIYVRGDLFSGSCSGMLAQLHPKILESIMLADSSPLFGVGYGLNIVTWSISAELFCYFLLWASYQSKSQSWFLPISFIIFGAFAMACFDVSSGTSSEWGLLRALIGFGFGWLIAICRRQFPSKPDHLIIKSILACGLLTLVPSILNAFPGYLSSVIIASMFAAIIFLATLFSKIQNFMIHKFLTRLGDWSYALYLTHTIILGSVLPRLEAATGSIASILAVVLCIAFSYAMHSFVDLPMQAFLRRKFLGLSQ